MESKIERAQRDSGLELLRIICMALIILYHYNVHGGYEPLNVNTLTVQRLFVQELGLFGRIACSVFAMTSGYFLVVSKTDKGYRRIRHLCVQLVVYYLGTGVAIYCLQPIRFSIPDMIRFWGTVFTGSWYINYYILWYLLLPFINPGLQRLNKGDYKKLLFIVYLIWSIIPTAMLATNFLPLYIRNWSFSNLDFFAVMYITGAYVRLHGNGNGMRKAACCLTGGVAAQLLLVALIDFIGARCGKDGFFAYADCFAEFNTIFSVVVAISAFYIFANIHFYNRAVNYIAASTTTIYILHDNKLMENILWKVISPNAVHIEAAYIHMPVKAAAVFSVFMLVDKLCEPFLKWINKSVDNMLLDESDSKKGA